MPMQEPPPELTPNEREVMKHLRSKGIVSVRELDSYSILVAESLYHLKVIDKVSSATDSVYVLKVQDPFGRRRPDLCLLS